MYTIKVASAMLIAGITALVGGAIVPSLTDEANAHQCLLPNSGNDPFPGQTPLSGNCPSGDQPLNGNQETARGLIGQQQNNNPTNFYCAETLANSHPGACPFTP